jgi:hypothetical protein
MRFGNLNRSNLLKNGYDGLRGLSTIMDDKQFEIKLLKKLRTPLFRSFFVTTPSEFQSGFRSKRSNFRFRTLEQEVIALKYQLKYSNALIAKYISLRDEIQEVILCGNYDAALHLLETLRRDTGTSYWYVQCKLSVLSEMGDDTETLNFYESLSRDVESEVEQRDLDIAFESAVKSRTAERNNAVFEAILEGLPNSGEASALEFLFRFNANKVKNEDYKDILQYIYPCNAIDKYFVLGRLAKLSFVREKLECVALNAYLEITDDLGDRNAANISTLVAGTGSFSEPDAAFVEISDRYLEGNYLEVIKLCEDYLVKYPMMSNAYEFYVNSIINSEGTCSFKEGTLLNSLINCIHAFIKGRGSVPFSSLERLYQQFQFLDCMQIIHLISIKKNICHEKSSVQKLYRYLDVEITPRNPFRHEGEAQGSLAARFASSDTESIKQLEVPDYRKSKWVADEYFYDGIWEDALAHYNLIKNKVPIHLKDEVFAKIVFCLIMLEEGNDVVNFISESYFEDSRSLCKLPKAMVFQKLENMDNLTFGRLNLVIAYFLLIGDNYTEHQAISLHLKDYLENIGVKYPSELHPDSQKIIFLLDKVCNMSILEGLGLYKSVNARLLDRVKILSNLQDELKETSAWTEEQDLLLLKYTNNLCVKKLGKGKLHVDKESIFVIAKDKLESRYSELQEALKLEHDNKNVKQVTVSKDESLKVISDSKVRNLLTYFMFEVRDIYTRDPTFGLDCSLNVDIRHNHIEPVIRSVFEKNDLICKKANRSYLDNDFIEENFRTSLTHDFYIKLQNCFKEFSEKVDTYLATVKTGYMKISRDEKVDPYSLFHFIVESDDINKLESLVRSGSTYTEIIHWIIDCLERKALGLLQAGRAVILRTMPLEFDEFIKSVKLFSNKLGKNAYRIQDKIVIAKKELNERLIEISQRLDFVQSAGENFILRTPCFEAQNFVQQLYPKVHVSMKYDNTHDVFLNGKNLAQFIRIFVIVFENAVKRRKRGDKSEIVVSCSHEEEKTNLVISSESGEIDKDKLALINKEVNNINYLDKANRENNSGFYKIKRILERDLSIVNHIELASAGSNFMVTLSFASKKLRVENENSIS